MQSFGTSGLEEDVQIQDYHYCLDYHYRYSDSSPKKYKIELLLTS